MTSAVPDSRVVYPPTPIPTELTRFFWEGLNRHELLILRCQDCGYYMHPPRPICRRCLSISMAPEPVSGRGVLYTYTVSVAAYHPYWTDRLPYVLAMVELDEQVGLGVTTNIVDCPESQLRVGLKVEVDFSEAAPGLVLPFFRPSRTA